MVCVYFFAADTAVRLYHHSDFSVSGFPIIASFVPRVQQKSRNMEEIFLHFAVFTGKRAQKSPHPALSGTSSYAWGCSLFRRSLRQRPRRRWSRIMCGSGGHPPKDLQPKTLARARTHPPPHRVFSLIPNASDMYPDNGQLKDVVFGNVSSSRVTPSRIPCLE